MQKCGQEWLDFDVDKDGHVIALKCKVCSTYSSNIENIKNFSHAFEGSVNLRVSNAMDHAKGGPHKSAMELYWKNSSISEEEKAEKLRDNQQQSIVPGIASMQAADLQKTKKKQVELSLLLKIVSRRSRHMTN